MPQLEEVTGPTGRLLKIVNTEAPQVAEDPDSEPEDTKRVFKSFVAQDGFELLGDGGGRVLSILPARQTHAMGSYLLDQALATGTKLTIVLTACWYDLGDLTEKLIYAARMQHKVTAYFDHKATLGGTTRDQLVRLKELKSNGVRVRIAQGYNLSPVYEEVERKAGGRGLLHAKTLLVGRHALVGSTNWTTSSKGNVEVSVLMALKKQGLTRYQTMLAHLDSIAQDLTEELIEEAERRKDERPRSRSVTPSRRYRANR